MTRKGAITVVFATYIGSAFAYSSAMARLLFFSPTNGPYTRQLRQSPGVLAGATYLQTGLEIARQLLLSLQVADALGRHLVPRRQTAVIRAVVGVVEVEVEPGVGSGWRGREDRLCKHRWSDAVPRAGGVELRELRERNRRYWRRAI